MSVRQRVYWGTGSLLVASLLSHGSASAQVASDPAAARALFAEARKLMAAKQYAQACPKFEESQRLDSGIGTMYNLADCWEHSGRTASAWAMFLDAAAAARASGQAARERAAKDRASALEPKLSHLTLQIATVDPGLEVQRDGQVVGAASYGVPVPVDPGSHRIDVSAPGKKPFTTTVDVGVSASVPAQIPKLDNADVVAPVTSTPGANNSGAASPGPATPDTTQKRSPQALSYALLGLGVVGVAVGSVFELKSRSDNSSALGLCPGDAACTQDDVTRHDSLVSDAKTDRAVGFVGLGVGAVSLVAAVVLLTTGHTSHEAAPTASWRLRFDANTRGAAALAEGQF
ncbi:MAG TPA: hypothetical protein VK745_02625 [Polyangiaceae bacterium]|nr:hypothetical protein [Polyangiaceae bacterium]